MKKVELLVPAGGYEQFIAAVENGADAVYLGASAFNARNFANNFSDEELKQAIEYAHLRNVKVYITMNILINDEEIEEAVSLAKKLYLIGADAFIVQDIGLIRILKEIIPDIDIHVSTQASIYSSEGIKSLDELDISRVVLARELSIKEIKEVCDNTDKEIEVFIHGAMCICYSGQCRFSSLVGERSGNRGKCAQPCRLPYTLCVNDKEYVKNYTLSPKDLCALYVLPDLIKAGVTSLKIEGRMKSPEYVACVTQIYRKYIDLFYSNEKYKVQNEDIKELAQVFNRGNFSDGYLTKRLGKDFISRERSKNWGTYLGEVVNYNKKKGLVEIKLGNNISMGDIVEFLNADLTSGTVTYIGNGKAQIKNAQNGDKVMIGAFYGDIKQGQKIYKISSHEQNKKLQETFDGKCHKKIDISAKIDIEIGKKITLSLTEENNKVTLESDFIVETAINRETSKEDVLKSLAKLGDTPFLLNEYEINIEKGSSVPLKVLNELRRNAVLKLQEKKIELTRKNEFNEIHAISISQKAKDKKISVYLYNTENLSGLNEADRVYVPINDYLAKKDEIEEKLKGIEVIPYVNAITKNMKYTQEVENILIGNLEHINIFKNLAKNIYGDHSLNAFNSYTCAEYEKMGLKGLNLSFELNLEQINNIKSNMELEVTVYGNLPLMISEHCYIGSEISGKINCNLCQNGKYSLKDRTGAIFPIITDRENCRSIILNSKKLLLPDAMEKVKNADYLRLYFYDETTSERVNIIKTIKENKKISCVRYTAGHFYRGV